MESGSETRVLTAGPRKGHRIQARGTLRLRVRGSGAATLLGLLLIGAAVCRAQAEAVFTAPGSNIALHKPYTLDPAPNYGDCSDDAGRTILTDGEYTRGYFWVQKTTVGWVHTRPVAVTVDLGVVQPIAGLSYSTAAGVAGVVWPGSIMIMVSDDGKQWTLVGDLVALSSKSGRPAPTPYSVHRFTTGDLRTRGRYVALVVDQAPYTVVDEIEVYQGPQEWLGVRPSGKRATGSPLEYSRARQLLALIQGRLLADLDDVCDGIEKASLGEAEKAALRRRSTILRAEVEAQDEVPERFTTVLPLNGLHARIYALHALVLRARGYRGLTVWGAHRYDMLQPMQAPATPPASTPSLRIRTMRNECRADVLNLTNATDVPLTATLKASGLGRAAACLTLRQVLFTDTRERTPVATALMPGQAAERGLRVTVEAGTTRQVWLDFRSRDLPAGEYKAVLRIRCRPRDEVTVPLRLQVVRLAMPAEFSVAIGGWDETNGDGSYDVTMQNMAPLIKNLRDHGVNMPWSNPRAVPSGGRYDSEGNLAAPPDFTTWDEWVNRWPGARHWGVFANVGATFNQEPIGTPRFRRMVGAWVTAWMQHAQAQGIRAAQIKVLLVDEPRADDQDRVIIAWAKAIHAAQPEVVIWNDPIHAEPEKVDAQFYATAGILSPNASYFLSRGKAYRDFYTAQQRAGRELWFYSCSGPSKLLDPAAYYRGQFWLNIKYGGRGSCYWAFGDEAGNSWNAYVQPRASFSPLFLSKTTVTDAKHMEAIREGAEDYETFAILRSRVAELERDGVRSTLLSQAKAFLDAGPAKVVETMRQGSERWTVPKQRSTMDTVRMRALDLLCRLSRR